MENTTLGINTTGNPVVFNDDRLKLLGSAPATTTLVEATIAEPDPSPSDSGTTGGDATGSTPTNVLFYPELLGLTGDSRGLKFIQCMRNAFEGQPDHVREEWHAAAESLLNEPMSSDETIDNTCDHYATDCEERGFYEGLEELNEQDQEKKRRAVPSQDDLNREYEENMLMGPGILLPTNVFAGVKRISETTPEEALRIASDLGIPLEDVRPHLRGLAALNERIRSAIDEDGRIRDPYVRTPMAQVYKSLVTDEIKAKIDAALEEVRKNRK